MESLPSLATPLERPSGDSLASTAPANTRMLPPGLLPRPPRHARREYLHARALKNNASSTSRPSRYDRPLDTPAQRRYHTERATRRVFGRVPTYLPRVNPDVLGAAAGSCTKRQHVEAGDGTAEASGARRAKRDRPAGSKKMSKIEARMKEMQLLRDKVAIKEAFKVIDDDGGGSVEAPEVLKALKALGKKLDDKTFWSKFHTLCDEGEMVIGAQQFEKLMLKLLESRRRKAARQPLAGELKGKATMTSGSYLEKKKAHGMASGVRHGLQNRLSRLREKTAFGNAQDNVRSTRADTVAMVPHEDAPQQAVEGKKMTKSAPASGSPAAPPLSGRGALQPVPPEKDGSEWMSEALEQHRGLKDIYTALTALRSSTVQARIADPPEDLR
jgi:hypothetical protein